MSYSGLIYAAIVACWAALLVPRWIRRNEEVERAREEDAARGVRILERRDGQARHGRPLDADGLQATEGEASEAVQSFGVAARRRRRVLLLLVALLGVVVTGAAAGRLPPGSVAVPATLLAGFLVLARRAAVAEARRRARVRNQLARRRTLAEEAHIAVPAPDTTERRVAVLDLPEPAEPADPNAWEPVPVPLPTYLTKAKAEAPAVRKIDLSSPGAWTSGRLNPASSISLPAARPAEDEDFPEQRRAVGG